MIVGFTGTRKGMTGHQFSKVEAMLEVFDFTDVVSVLHHGGCVGADAQVHSLATELGWNIVIHPPTNDRYQATLYLAESQFRAPKPYLERNHNIVDETDCLIAAPGQMNEIRRSGTWATIRYARKQGKTVLLVLPEE